MLSIIIIAKNEEDVIESCLESIKDFGSEVIVIDGKSTDRTAQKAVLHGAKVVINPFEDFSTQRNHALKLIKNDWFLYIDADERITKDFIEEVKKVIQEFDPSSGIGGYFIKRKTFYYGRDWGLTDQVQRLFYKKSFIGWEGIVHESPKIIGTFGTIESPINHYTHRNLSQMLEKTNAWSEYEAKLRFEANHPKMNVLRFMRIILTGFMQSYFGNYGYKNGAYGLIESIYQSYSLFITYAKLWELQIKKR